MSRVDLNYDPADRGLASADLEAKYVQAGQHPAYTRVMWYEVLSKFPEVEETVDGYWPWVWLMIANEAPLPGTAQTVPVAAEDIIDVTTIDQFAGLVGKWHHNKVAVLEHMMTIPEGTEVAIKIGDEEKAVKLEGDVLAGFQAGLQVALVEFSQLPFVVSVDDNDDTSSSGQ